MLCVFFVLRIPRPPSSTLFPYTTLFRSARRRLVPGEESERRLRLRLRNQLQHLIACPRACHWRKSAVSDRDRLRSEEHTSELQSRQYLVCRLLLEKNKPAASGGCVLPPI